MLPGGWVFCNCSKKIVFDCGPLYGSEFLSPTFCNHKVIYLPAISFLLYVMKDVNHITDSSRMFFDFCSKKDTCHSINLKQSIMKRVGLANIPCLLDLKLFRLKFLRSPTAKRKVEPLRMGPL